MVPTRDQPEPPAPTRPVAVDPIADDDPRRPAEWPAEPGLRMLNHGSYGLTPRYLRRRQAALRDRMDADPVRWFKQELEQRSDAARAAVARFVNAAEDRVTFVPNATVGVATVLHSLDLQRGDEVVATDQEYQATLNELERLAERRGVITRLARLPLPTRDPGELVERVAERITDRTRLVVISHIASAAAVVMPVRDVIRVARERGVEVLVDGAHGPGQVELDLAAMGPTYYVASGHKWLCTPKGSGFLYTDAHAAARVRPLALSCRAHLDRPERPSYLSDFDYVGTGDFTANLVMPDAIAHLGAQLATPNADGWDALRAHNTALVRAGAQRIMDRCGLEPIAPLGRTAFMVAMRLPPRRDRATGKIYDDPIWERLLERHRIQVPVWSLPGGGVRVIRISAHLHNTPDDYDALADALAEELDHERRRGLLEEN